MLVDGAAFLLTGFRGYAVPYQHLSKNVMVATPLFTLRQALELILPKTISNDGLPDVPIGLPDRPVELPATSEEVEDVREGLGPALDPRFNDFLGRANGRLGG